MNKDLGGPAFPNEGGHKFTSGNEVRKTLPHPGMTLRDYFAAKAMQGILSDQATVSAFDDAGKRDLVQPAALVATASYSMADAMLKERAK